MNISRWHEYFFLLFERETTHTNFFVYIIFRLNGYLNMDRCLAICLLRCDSLLLFNFLVFSQINVIFKSKKVLTPLNSSRPYCCCHGDVLFERVRKPACLHLPPFVLSPTMYRMRFGN